MKRNEGFTLIELICTIAIMTILTGFVFPVGMQYMNRAGEVKEESWARGLWQTIQIYMIEEHNGEYIPGYELVAELEDNSIPAVKEIVQPYWKKRSSKDFSLQNVNVSKSTYEMTQIKYETERWYVTVTKDSVKLLPK